MAARSGLRIRFVRFRARGIPCSEPMPFGHQAPTRCNGLISQIASITAFRPTGSNRQKLCSGGEAARRLLLRPAFPFRFRNPPA